MRKVFISLVCAMFALPVLAQRASSSSSSFFSTESADQSITFSIRGGLNFANMTLSENGYSMSPKSNTGWHAGIAVDFPIIESFYVQSGLYYTVKGFKSEDDDYEEKANPAYLEIPILASYRYNFSESAQLQINFGPYLAYGIGGKVKEKEYGYGEDEWDFFDDDDINKFDMGLQVGAGITFAKHIYVGCGYEFGLTNILKDSGNAKWKNKNFFVNVGFQF